MADETVINGEYSDDQAVEITGDKISDLLQQLSELELQNDKINGENGEYKHRIEELKASLADLSSENQELKMQLETAVSETKGLKAVAARAAELEAVVSRLQHDLVSATSDLQEANVELSGMKGSLEGMKEREKEKDVELSAVVKERDLLVTKVEKLYEVEGGLKDELEGKEKEVIGLKKRLEELDAVKASKESAEKKVKNLEEEIYALKIKEDSPEMIERAVNGEVEVGTKWFAGDWKRKDWVVAGGSSVAAVAVLGVACYVHAAKKH